MQRKRAAPQQRWKRAAQLLRKRARRALICVCRRVFEKDDGAQLPVPRCRSVHTDNRAQSEDDLTHMATLKEVTPSADRI